MTSSIDARSYEGDRGPVVMWNCTITRVEFCDGGLMDNTPGVVVFVGPNNGGKSRTLTEIVSSLGFDNGPNHKCVRKVVTTRPQSGRDLLALLESTAFVSPGEDDQFLIGGSIGGEGHVSTI